MLKLFKKDSKSSMPKYKTFYEYAKDFNKESSSADLSLFRFVAYIKQYDCGIVTAYHSGYTHIQNQKRNKSLNAKLAAMTYGITTVKGSFVENFGTDNEKEVEGHIIFVVDVRNRKNLEVMLRELGEEFGIDSILNIPKDNDKSCLIGTKKNTYPGYGVNKELPIIKLGKDDYEFLCQVDGRPYNLKNEIISEQYCGNNLGLFAAWTEAKQPWRKLDIEAYWISPDGLIMDVEKTHIQAVIDHPSVFNLSKTDIQNTYLFEREDLGFEGKAREKIILDLIKQGYIRIRYYPKESTWTINVFNIDLKTIDVLQMWVKMVLKNGFSKYDLLKIDMPYKQMYISMDDILLHNFEI